MRGKELLQKFADFYGGITPAYAGKSVIHSVTLYRDPGSPPPMRGKVLLLLAYATINRITPAYAGKSTAEASPRCRFWDHPRLCGEKVAFPLPLTR